MIDVTVFFSVNFAVKDAGAVGEAHMGLTNLRSRPVIHIGKINVWSCSMYGGVATAHSNV